MRKDLHKIKMKANGTNKEKRRNSTEETLYCDEEEKGPGSKKDVERKVPEGEQARRI